MELPGGDRARRRRTEYGKRSKQGCRTCISKKVKCDEHHPRCGRCVRLDLSCEWARVETSLAVRRRGYGPIKGRDNWQPPVISPKPQTCVDQLQDDAPSARRVGSHGDARPLESGRLESSSTPANTCDLALEHGVALEDPAIPRLQRDIEQDVAPSSPCPSAVVLLPRLTINRTMTLIENSDLQAVAFHRGVLAPLKSTRASAESAHSIFLDRAIGNDMALHFLLAVSHSELAIYRGECIRAPQEAWHHFRHGSQLLSNHRNQLSRPDHVATLLSFLYMYMFWMRRGPFDQSMLWELSRSVLLHVKTYNLDNLGDADGSGTATAMPDKVLISRILTYLYDRDGFCYFFGCGGAFANYVSDHHDKGSQIWRLSQTGYPWSPSIPAPAPGTNQGARLENKRITDVYFQLIAIHHDINRYSQECEIYGLETKIRTHLERLGKEEKCTFNIVDECERRASKPGLMALVTASFYYAILIYLHRSRHSPFGGRPVPSDIQSALGKLVSTAYYTVASGPVQLLERFQWALLIAGIETNDPVHRDWVRGNIADPSLKGTLELVLDAQRTRPLSMREIRQLVSGVNGST